MENIKKEKYLKLIFGVILISLILGGTFLFTEKKKLEKENIILQKEISQKTDLTYLLDNQYSSFFEEVPEDWKTYRNEKYGFEMKYPSKIMEGKSLGLIEKPLTGTTIYGLEAMEDIHIPYVKEKQPYEELFKIGTTVIPGDLPKLEFLITESSGQKSFCSKFFCNRKLFYFNEGIPIYEFSTGFFEKDILVISKRDYFIVNAKAKLIFYIWYVYDSDVIEPEIIEKYLPITVFEGVLSTFKFLK
ncbi:hypothetical protein KAU51_02830 [Candidatus Parcubacteria bacterium]|nr:hypothetical protein [Candidatus Parcubacteria bacterium]